MDSGLFLSAKGTMLMINDLCLNYIHNVTSTYMKAIKPVNKTVSDNTSFLKI